MARLIVFTADLAEIIARTEPRAGIRWARPADCAALEAAGLDGKWAAAMLRGGSRFVVAEEQGRMVGCSAYLLRERVRPYGWLAILPRPGRDVVSIGVAVVPERRGDRLFGGMQAFAARAFAAEGYGRMVACVERDNRSAIRAQRRIGAVPAASLTRLRIGRLMLVWRGWRPSHISWRRGRRFELRL